MPQFSDRSHSRLAECHPRIQAVMNLVIPHYDFTVICGHRTAQEQNEAYENGFSNTPYPFSKHNKWPSLAVDVAPYPVNWDDREAFYYLAGRVMQVADSLGIRLRWGGDWDMDDDLHDQSFMDLGHFELLDTGPSILYADEEVEWDTSLHSDLT